MFDSKDVHENDKALTYFLIAFSFTQLGARSLRDGTEKPSLSVLRVDVKQGFSPLLFVLARVLGGPGRPFVHEGLYALIPSLSSLRQGAHPTGRSRGLRSSTDG